MSHVLPKYAWYLLILAFVGYGCGISDPTPELVINPSISSINPTTGPMGTLVTINGSGFSPIPSNNRVTFNGVEADIFAADSNSIETMVPDSATTGPVRVTAGGTTATGPVFTVDQGMPGISAVDPDSGVVGTAVTIRGSNFGATPSENTVLFNDTMAPVNTANDSLITTEVPAGATTGPVSVVVDQDTAVGPVFTVIIPQPTINSVDPDSGTVGTPVTIRGENFSPTPSENTITFNGVNAPVNSASDTLLDTEVPSGASTGPVEVIVDGQTATGPTFTVITDGTLQVIVTTSGPDQDPDGYTVTLDGSDSRASATEDTLFYADQPEGSHSLELSGNAANCTVGGSNPRNVNITAGDTTSTTFDLSCTDILRNQIVFHTDRDGNQEIYLMNGDGTGQTNLTNNAASDVHPHVSPDGSRIVFTSDRDGNDELFIMDADGSNVTQLTFTASGITNRQPAWSPDGSQIAFTRFTGAQNFEVFVINSDGSGETNITNHSADDGQPDWKPDGTRIAFVSDRDGDFEIFTMNPDGSSITQLTSNIAPDHAPAWSPDGSQIAYRDHSLQSANIFVMDADGSNQSGVTGNFATDDLPDWSPDGSRLVYQSDESGDLEIYLINTDGTGKINISNMAAADDEHPSWSPVQ